MTTIALLQVCGVICFFTDKLNDYFQSTVSHVIEIPCKRYLLAFSASLLIESKQLFMFCYSELELFLVSTSGLGH